MNIPPNWQHIIQELQKVLPSGARTAATILIGAIIDGTTEWKTNKDKKYRHFPLMGGATDPYRQIWGNMINWRHSNLHEGIPVPTSDPLANFVSALEVYLSRKYAQPLNIPLPPHKKNL